MDPWMRYDAYGNTGRPIAREAVKRGFHSVLDDRNPEALPFAASELQLASRAFGLDDPESVGRALTGMSAVLTSATGPHFVEGFRGVRRIQEAT